MSRNELNPEVLIDLGQTLYERLATLQAAGPENPCPFPIEDQREVIARYRTWTEICMSILDYDERQRFHGFYYGTVEGSLTLPGMSMRDFLLSPLATREDVPLTDMFRSSGRQYPLKWQHPFIFSFAPGFRKQTAMLAELRISRLLRAPSVPVLGANVDGWHPAVVQAVGSRFEHGHYDDALLKATSALIEAAKKKAGFAGDTSKSDMNHMGHIFSTKHRVLRVRDHEREQEGYMHLFQGVVGAVRNVAAHPNGGAPAMDRQEASEWLGTVSALFRILDRVEVTPLTPRDVKRGESGAAALGLGSGSADSTG